MKQKIFQHQSMCGICSQLLFSLFEKVCCLRDTASCYTLIVAIGSRHCDVALLLWNLLSACYCDVAMLCWIIYDVQLVVEELYNG